MTGDDRAARWAAVETIGRYHEAQLRLLLEPIREALARMDAGELDAFYVDNIIHHYKRSARALWKFCGQTPKDMLFASRTLDYWREHGEEPADWWQAGEPRRRE